MAIYYDNILLLLSFVSLVYYEALSILHSISSDCHFSAFCAGCRFKEHFGTDLFFLVNRGVFAMIAVFLAYSFLQAPST
jgi:hypothetical protein